MSDINSIESVWGGFVPAWEWKMNVGYTLTHLKTGKVYAGSSGDMYRRRNSHFNDLKNNKHSSQAFQDAFNDDPRFDLKVYLAEDREAAFDVEQELITTNMRKGISLNVATDARRSAFGRPMSYTQKQAISEKLTGRKISEDTKAKLSLAMKRKPIHANTIDAVKKAKTGSTQSEETIAKIKASVLANFVDGKLPQAHADNIRASKLKTQFKVNADGVIFDSVKDAATHFGLSPSGIQLRCLNEKLPTWFYIKPE